MPISLDDLIGDRRAMARLISAVENGEPAAQVMLSRLYPSAGRAHVVGVTGPPGCGKSTLVCDIVRWLRTQTGAPRVAVVAVDPTSPFSGGAILGDRLRMRDLAGDPGVFIRSMASRGALGGIASATADVVDVLDACGYDLILIETVGAGQLEVDVASVAHTVIVVEAPGAGDDIQAVKAGILEIADLIVVNKADRDGVAQTIAALQAAVDLAPAIQSGGWRVPILKTCALRHEGAADVIDGLRRHGDFLRRSGEGARRRSRSVQRDIESRLADLLLKRALGRLPGGRYQRLVDAVARRDVHPLDAARDLLGAAEIG